MDPNLSVAVALGAFFIWALVVWNRLVRLKAEVSAALTGWDDEAQRLRDLVAGLEQTARAHLGPEAGVLVAVSEAREEAQQAPLAGATTAPDAFADGDALSARAGANERLAAAVNRLLAAMEAHPQLKADASLQRAAGELTLGDDRLAALRQTYNQAASAYNAALQAFPAVMFAGMLGFKPAVPIS